MLNGFFCMHIPSQSMTYCIGNSASQLKKVTYIINKFSVETKAVHQNSCNAFKTDAQQWQIASFLLFCIMKSEIIYLSWYFGTFKPYFPRQQNKQKSLIVKCSGMCVGIACNGENQALGQVSENLILISYLHVLQVNRINGG